MNPQNGKGSARRKGANDKAYADGYDRIFSKVKCPECGSTEVELTWIDSIGAMPEWQQGYQQRPQQGYQDDTPPF